MEYTALDARSVVASKYMFDKHIEFVTAFGKYIDPLIKSLGLIMFLYGTFYKNVNGQIIEY